jgi:hypothetical protein
MILKEIGLINSVNEHLDGGEKRTEGNYAPIMATSRSVHHVIHSKLTESNSDSFMTKIYPLLREYTFRSELLEKQTIHDE